MLRHREGVRVTTSSGSPGSFQCGKTVFEGRIAYSASSILDRTRRGALRPERGWSGNNTWPSVPRVAVRRIIPALERQEQDKQGRARPRRLHLIHQPPGGSRGLAGASRRALVARRYTSPRRFSALPVESWTVASSRNPLEHLGGPLRLVGDNPAE